MKFSEMEYKRPALDTVLSECDRLAACFSSASSAQEQLSLYKERQNLMSAWQTMANLAYIRNSVDTRDDFYNKEREFFDEADPLLQEKSLLFSKALLSSAFRSELEASFGSILFKNAELQIKALSSEILPLMQEENKLASQYEKLYASAQVEFQGKPRTISQLSAFKQAPDPAVRRAAYEAEASFFDSHQEEFDELFSKLVSNRTAQAKRLGFQSYVELGYLRQYRNCYGPKEVAVFRSQVTGDLVPIVGKIIEAQRKRIGSAASPGKLAFSDSLFSFSDGNPMPQGSAEELLAAGRKMYSELSPETAEFIGTMFDMELFDVLSKEGKAPGGYCITLPEYRCPFIFSNFNGTSGDVDVLTHEAGHAFAAYLADRLIPWQELRCPTMEGAETHSMSMEFLTEPWHSLFFGEQTGKYQLFHAEDALKFIPYGTQVDHFQELIYLNPEMTPEERNQTWLELDRLYRPYIDYDALPFYSRGAGWQRQMHIYASPFYYLEYCLAGSAALEFWAMSMTDWKKAWDTYLSLVKLGGTKTFIELLHAVGLNSPLDDGCLKSICEPIEHWLFSHQLPADSQ